MSIPKVNTTVAAVRESWAGIEARRASRQAPGGGTAGPMDPNHRREVYRYTNGTHRWTAPQRRRAWQKMGVIMAREARAFAVSTLDGGQ